MGEIVQAMLQQQSALERYVTDLRTSVTGDLRNKDGAATPQPAANPTFDPGDSQNPRLTPASPNTNPSTPRTATQRNTTNSVPGEHRLNPGAPTNNPFGPGG